MSTQKVAPIRPEISKNFAEKMSWGVPLERKIIPHLVKTICMHWAYFVQ